MGQPVPESTKVREAQRPPQGGFWDFLNFLLAARPETLQSQRAEMPQFQRVAGALSEAQRLPERPANFPTAQEARTRAFGGGDDLNAAFDADVRAGGGRGPIGETEWAGFTDPWTIREPKTGLPLAYRKGTPEYAKAPVQRGDAETAPARATAGAVGGGASAAAKAPAGKPAEVTAPAATGWEEDFYRAHGRFPTEWDYADKKWSVGFASRTGRAPTREDWVQWAKQNIYHPERPTTIPEFAPGFGLDTGFGPYRPAPMSAVPEFKGERFENPTGAARTREAPAAALEAAPPEPKAKAKWGQLIPQEWDTQTTDQIFGQWLAEGGSGEPDDWAAHLQAIGAGA